MRSSNPTSAWATTARTSRPSSSATSSKTLGGTISTFFFLRTWPPPSPPWSFLSALSSTPRNKKKQNRYTQYTPYQAEIAQGRLEALLTFQTAVTDLTGMQISNASLLDEATAAAEAMTMCSALARGKKTTFLVSDACHPQTVEVCKTRADGLGLKVVVAKEADFAAAGLKAGGDVCGVLVQYPGTDGTVPKGGHKATVELAHSAKAKVCVATDLLALTKLAPPGEWGADIVVGSAQRFGVPMGYGGPHAAFLACHDEYKRLMPGRIIGVSRDAAGAPCLRMAMQTREQHIRRDKATSNICTAQALLANIAGLYAVYHGPEGLTRIADRVHGLAATFAAASAKAGMAVPSSAASYFDTVTVSVPDSGEAARKRAVAAGFNVRVLDAKRVAVAFDETSLLADVDALVGKANAAGTKAADLASSVDASSSLGEHARSSPFLEHSVFNSYHSEHEMLRYLKKLENRDLSLCHSMIPLGSCTMKLNATSEMMPVTWPELANLHPFAPLDQAKGYAEMFEHLATQLAEITGFDAVSLQPNSGASGEYAGLMAIRAFHRANGDGHRNVCIIPVRKSFCFFSSERERKRERKNVFEVEFFGGLSLTSTSTDFFFRTSTFYNKTRFLPTAPTRPPPSWPAWTSLSCPSTPRATSTSLPSRPPLSSTRTSSRR